MSRVTQRVVDRISRVGHVTWHVYASVGRRRDAAGKGASAALCSRWEFRSHASRRFVSRRRPAAVARETTLPYMHTHTRTRTCIHLYVYGRTYAHVQSRTVRPDTKLCRIACRDPRVTRRAIRVSGSAPRDDRVRRCISRLLLQFSVMWLAWRTACVALSKLAQIK